MGLLPPSSASSFLFSFYPTTHPTHSIIFVPLQNSNKPTSNITYSLSLLWEIDRSIDISMYSDVYGRLGSTSAAGGGGFMAAALSAATSTIAVDRAGIASRNHREAEKRRRERIKSHLDRLRHLLSCDPKVIS